MLDNTETYLNLGRCAMRDPSLIANHIDADIPFRLYTKLKDNLLCVDALHPACDDFTQKRVKECIEGIDILTFYQEAYK